MSDVSYLIDAQLRLSGGAAGAFNSGMQRSAQAVQNVQQAMSQVSTGFRQMAGGVTDIVDRALSTGARVAAGLTAAGAVGAIAMAKSVGTNLSMLEDKSISMGAVMAAATGQSFATMKAASAGLFEQFEKDAVTAAGSTADFVGVANSLAGPVLGAGKGMGVLHDLTKSAMDAAGPLGISYEQMGSSVTMMLQGMATAHDPLFRAMKSIPSLGIKSTEAFQALSQEAKIATLQAALGNQAFKDGNVAMGQSWTGLRSTLTDVFARMGKFAGLPLFEQAKRGLSRFNDAMISALTDGRLKDVLSTMGMSLATRFGEIGDTLKRIFPDFIGSGEDAITRIGGFVSGALAKVNAGLGWVADHWTEITTGAHAFADAIERGAHRASELVKTLGGGDFAKGLERVAELMVAKQAVSATMPIAGGAITAASGLANVARFAAPMAAAPTAAVGAETAAGGAVAAGGLAGAATAIAAATGAVLAFGAAAVLIGPYISGVWDRVTGALPEAWDRNVLPRIEPLRAALSKMWDALAPIRDALMYVGAALVALPFAPFIAVVTAAAAAIDYCATHADQFTTVLGGMAGALADAADEVSKFINRFKKVLPPSGASPLDVPETYAPADYAGMGGVAMGTGARGGVYGGPMAATPAPKGGGGGGQKVEVTIKWDLGDGNEDAIYVKSKKDIASALKNARQIAKSSTVAGAR